MSFQIFTCKYSKSIPVCLFNLDTHLHQPRQIISHAKWAPHFRRFRVSFTQTMAKMNRRMEQTIDIHAGGFCINDCEWINSRCHGCSISALDKNSANSCYRFVFAKYSNIEIWCILRFWKVIPQRRKSISFIENISPRIYILTFVCFGYTSLIFCIHLIYLWHFPWLLYRHRGNHMPIPVRSYDSARNLY